PRAGGGTRPVASLTADSLRRLCWTGGEPQLSAEELERRARAIWPDLSRPRLETVLREGVTEGVWAAWRQGADATFFQHEDGDPPIQVGAAWQIVDASSTLAQQLESLRPGRGPQPV